ncbi:MAG: EutN/CcmL family microcompartment protein [Nitrososphaerales archaeon]
MIIAKVVGSAVSTMKLDALQSSKLLIVRPADAQGNATGAPFLAVDLVGAGEDELVMISEGSSARMAIGNDRSPADAAITGILDSLRYYGDLVYRKA